MNLRWIVGYWTCISFTVIGLVAAEEPSAKPQAEKPAATSPELLELLQKWEAASSQGEVVEIQFERYSYNSVFCSEERGLGRFVYRAPDQGLIELKPMPLKIDETSTRKDPDGRPYVLRSTHPEIWYWDEKSVYSINTQSKTYRRIEKVTSTPNFDSAVPDSIWGDLGIWKFASQPKNLFPQVIAVKPERSHEQEDLELEKEYRPRLIVMTGFGLMDERWRNEYKQIELLFAQDSLGMQAVRIHDAAGLNQTVCVIKDMKTDPAQIGDWRPKLSQYKSLNDN